MTDGCSPCGILAPRLHRAYLIGCAGLDGFALNKGFQVDFGSFKKLEGFPEKPGQVDGGTLKLIVKLREGAQRPAYLPLFAQAGPRIFTTEIASDQLGRLEEDPAILTFETTKTLNRID